MRLRFVSRQLWAAAIGGALLGGCVEGAPLVRSFDAQAPAFVTDRNTTRLMYALPTAKVPITITGKDDLVTLEVGAPKYYPDFKHHYVIEYAHNELSDDVFHVDIDPVTMLLKKVSTTTKDKTTELVPLITSTVSELKKTIAAVAASKGLDVSPAKPVRPPFKITMEIDPATDADRVRQQLHIVNETGWNLKFDAAAVPLLVNGQKYSDNQITAQQPDCTVGVCFRMPRQYQMKLSNTLNTRVDIAEANMMLPNNGLIGSVEFRRRAFVENKVTVEFDNGMLKNVEMADPSEAVGFMKLPSQFLQLVVAGATL